MKTYSAQKYLIPLVFSLLISIACYTPVFAVQRAFVEYNSDKIDYSVMDAAKVQNEATAAFNQALSSTSSSDKEKFFDIAMDKYYILTKIYPEKINPSVQLARIYDVKNKDKLAKQYFYHATNIEPHNAFANFYFGEYYFNRKDYKRALKYYLIAYNNGYNNFYMLNYRLGTIYEKFADLSSAKRFYNSAYSLRKDNPELPERVNSINELNYDKSEYYYLIRE